MNVLVKSDVIWIRPVPRETVKDGIQLFIPKSISETRNGYTTYDVIKGQGDYQLPEPYTADDIADIKVRTGIVMIDFK